MKVRILLDTVDYKAGRIVQMDDFLANRWIYSGLAEAVGGPETASRALPTPENKALDAPTNRVVKPRKRKGKE